VLARVAGWLTGYSGRKASCGRCGPAATARRLSLDRGRAAMVLRTKKPAIRRGWRARGGERDDGGIDGPRSGRRKRFRVIPLPPCLHRV